MICEGTFVSLYFFFSSRRRHTRFKCDWSSDVCSSDLRVILECPQALIPLLKTCRGIDAWVAQGSQLPEFDVHAPLMTLPRLFGTTVAKVPTNIPYLTAEPERIEPWQRDLAPIQGFKIGMFWQGNPHDA